MRLACKDINPTTTCTFEVEGATARDAAQKMLIHARAEHTADIASMGDEEALRMMEEKVHE